MSDPRRLDMEGPDAGFEKAVRLVTDEHERVLLTSSGTPVFALIPAEDLELLEELEDWRDRQEAALSLAEARAVGTVPLGQLRAELSDEHSTG